MRIFIEKLSGILIRTRQKIGFSQSYVARKIRVSQKTYSRLERGLIKLDLERFLLITDCLGIHPMEIINSIFDGKSNWGESIPPKENLAKENERLAKELETSNAALEHFKQLFNKLVTNVVAKGELNVLDSKEIAQLQETQ